jgi:MFS transporter, NRE family, putaive nickel resistance protein
MPLLVYDMTGSARLLGAMLVLQTLPKVVLAPIAGLLADRTDRRTLMLRANLLRAGSVALIPFSNEIWQIALLAVIVSIGMAVNIPAELSALPQTVPKPFLVPALSLTQVSSNIMRVVGPAAGAGLIGVAGTSAAFWTETILFLASAACVVPLVLPVSTATVSEPTLANAGREMLEGLQVVWRTPIVRAVTATECLWALIGASTTIAGLVYVERTLDLGDRAELVYGLLAASLSAGALTGALLASTVEHRIGRPAMLAAGYLGPLMVIPVLLLPPVPILFGLWFLFGVADALAVIAMQAYLAESVSDGLRGRVYSTWSGLVTLSWMICFGGVGWITSHVGPAWMIAGAGLIVGLGGPLLLVLSGALDAVRAPHPKVADT